MAYTEEINAKNMAKLAKDFVEGETLKERQRKEEEKARLEKERQEKIFQIEKIYIPRFDRGIFNAAKNGYYNVICEHGMNTDNIAYEYLKKYYTNFGFSVGKVNDSQIQISW